MFLVTVPLSTTSGFHGNLFNALFLGIKIILMERWNAKKAVEYIQKEECTIIQAAMPLLLDLMECVSKNQELLYSLRLFICGGAPIPNEVIIRAHNILYFNVVTMYGFTDI